jgi:hypothetical protein
VGAFRYERIPAVKGSAKNVIEFDSSADLAISRAYGYENGSVELRETDRNETRIVFDVFARDHRAEEGDPPKPLTKRGRLTCLTRDEAWKRDTSGPHYGSVFA